METTEIINGYSVIGKWKNGQRGMTALATRSGKKYFLKKYTKFVLPTDDGMFDAKTIQVKKRDFDDFVKIRKKVIARISPIAGPGGNIIIPCDNFVDGIHYYEATEFIDGVIPDEEVTAFFSGMSDDEKMLMMKTAAGALSAVHSSGIIHSDLKLKNIIVVKNSRDNFVAKLIDFDSSYPDDEKKYIGGDDVYCSTELAQYSNSEDDEEMSELVKKISNKTDIFSLGVCFHYYLTQEYPTAVELSPRLKRQKDLKERAGKPVTFFTSQLLLEGCELKLSDKIESVNLKMLIYDMLSMYPGERPTAMQVLQRLKQSEPTIETPWPEHSITLDNTKLSSDGIVGLKKIRDGVPKYELIFSAGKKRVVTVEELVEAKYAKTVFVPKGFHDIWSEHAIEFDEDKLSSRGFVSETKETLGGKKGYKLYRKDGTGMFFTIEKLLGTGYVKRIGTSSEGEIPKEETDPTSSTSSTSSALSIEPWPEHKIRFDVDVIKGRGHVRIERSELNNVKGYRLYKADGKGQFARVEMLIAWHMAVKIS